MILSLLAAVALAITSPTDYEPKCGAKTTCKEMTSCTEARYYLEKCKVKRLDNDKDGTPCESLCKR